MFVTSVISSARHVELSLNREPFGPVSNLGQKPTSHLSLRSRLRACAPLPSPPCPVRQAICLQNCQNLQVIYYWYKSKSHLEFCGESPLSVASPPPPPPYARK
ncbi:hypothetical protein J6590_082534 [Homalodisca vitripennis]|nr:hypothetical protein J6590_082534 [Homalodisca vitripennis]